MFCGKGGSVQVANARDSAQLRAGRSDLDSDGRLQGMVLRPLEHGVPSTGRRFPLGGPVESRCQKRKFGQVSLTGSLCPNGISGFLRFPVSPPAPPPVVQRHLSLPRSRSDHSSSDSTDSADESAHSTASQRVLLGRVGHLQRRTARRTGPAGVLADRTGPQGPSGCGNRTRKRNAL